MRKLLLGNVNPGYNFGPEAKSLGFLCVNETDGDITYNFARDSFSDILNRLPEGWVPDAVVWWAPEYHPVPEGIENSPIPTVAMAGDWNLCFNTLKENLKRFDFIVADKAGVEAFRRAGYSNIDYWSYNAYTAGVHKIIPGTEKIYDAVFIGTVNNDIHRKREKFLYRLARMADKYKVKIFTGVYGDEYIKVLNQTKIAFNYGIRREVNMRSFEAPSCGALLFMEETNLEVRDFFTDREECVLYNEENFEELLEYYINKDRERDKITSAALNKVKNHTYRDHFFWLIELLERNGVFEMKNDIRAFSLLPQSFQYFQKGLMAMDGIGSEQRMLAARKFFDKAVSFKPDNPEYWNSSGLLYANRALTAPEPEKGSLFKKSLRMFNKALAISPEAVIACFNQANITLAMGQKEAARNKFLNAAELLKRQEINFSCHNLLFPVEYNLFRVEWEDLTAAHTGNHEKLYEEYKKILLWKCCEKLADLSDPFEAEKWYEKSISARPDLAGEARRKLASLLAVQEKKEEAFFQYKLAIETEPFNAAVWFETIDFLYKSGFCKDCAEYCKRFLSLGAVSPLYRKWVENSYTVLGLMNGLTEEGRTYILSVLEKCHAG